MANYARPMRLRDTLLLAALAVPLSTQGRDMSVFGILRLDMPSARVTTPEPGKWAVDMALGYQNTWSMSPNIQDYFETRNFNRSLTPIDIAEIHALPFEKFLVDLEMGLAEVTARRRLSGNWTAYANLSAVSYQGGFMDSSIERFHDALGFREYVRGAVPRNRFAILAELKETHSLLLDAPSGGMLDPVLGIRYTHARLAIDAAVKVPLGGTREFLSNGNADVGLQASLQETWGRHTAYGSLAGVSTKSAGIVVDSDKRHFVPTLIAGYEFAFDAKTSAFLQGHATRYALDSDDTDIGGLRQTKVQASFGVRHRLEASMLTFTLTEGFGAYNGMPDLGFQLGWTVDLR